MPQLDSLRALAFFGVAASHWLTVKFHPAIFGGTGVQLFFVLSGFLITGILLDYRATQQNSTALTPASALRTFYARRFLRIFPLFYGVLVIGLLLDLGPIRRFWPWHVLYSSNFLYALHHPTVPDPFRHFWSLAVEEQFYLVWPFLIFFVRLETLRRLIVALVLAAPVFRIAMQLAFPEMNRANYLPLSCGDSLGVGAWLAFAARYQTQLTRPVRSLANAFGLIGLAGGLVTVLLMGWLGKTIWLEQSGHTFLVLAFAWLVFGAAQGFAGPLGWILNRPTLQFLGRISYGLYVYHNLFTYLRTSRVLAPLGLPIEWSRSFAVQITIRLLLTLLVATLSWYFYEQPFNNLKRFFSLRRKLVSSANLHPLPRAELASEQPPS